MCTGEPWVIWSRKTTFYLCHQFELLIQVDAHCSLIPTPAGLLRCTVCLISFLLGLPMVCNGGYYLFYLIDNTLAGYPLLCICIVELVVIGYLYGEWLGQRRSRDFDVWVEGSEVVSGGMYNGVHSEWHHLGIWTTTTMTSFAVFAGAGQGVEKNRFIAMSLALEDS